LLVMSRCLAFSSEVMGRTDALEVRLTKHR
jgi:hypothetical protein